MGRLIPLSRSTFTRVLAAAVVSFLFVIGPAVLFADDGSIAGAAALVAIGADGEGGDTIRRVALSSIQIYLEQEGVAVYPSDERPTDENLTRAITRDGDRSEAQFVVHGLLTVDGGEVDVQLRLFLLDGEQLLATDSSVEPIGLTLDRAIGALTGSLVERARPYFEAAAAQRVETGTVVSTQDTGLELTFVPPGTEQVAVTPAKDRLFAFEASYAPFFPVDAAAGYVSSSYSAASVTILSMPFSVDYLGLGLTVRGILADATGASTSASLQMLPFGITARFSGEPAPYAPFVLATAGGAVLAAENPTLGSFVSFAPAFSGAIGMRFELERFGGAQVYIGFDAILEGSISILGFSPGLGLAFWF